ncbi:Homeodomain-like protein [Botryosphaeria dothidea]|uniref:Homeodomain-like protein n=1 Tax=Botryosphaeria dothidea TaxID=55169 RepID=A0A8H4N1V0_9PEZI|nr:Homeodomain-like protein [Botryosphaeria dothidea]
MADLFDKTLEENHGDDRLTDDGQGYSTSEPAPDGDSDQEEEEQDVEHAQDALDAVPAARLLRLSKWLELSGSVFANAGGAREAENWRSIAEPGEQISIFHSAFSDLHRLADGHTADDAQATEHITSDTETDSDLDNPDAEQETYAELFDVQQSHQEEERLWQLLGQDVMPAAEWERYGRPIDSARPVDVNAGAFASVNRGFETARSPPPLLARAETGALDVDQTSLEEPPQDIASPITEEGEEDGSDVL